MGNTKIDGTGGKGNGIKQTISKRAVAGKLFIIKEKCKFCGHPKMFSGNPLGLNIIKCCKCKRYKESMKK